MLTENGMLQKVDAASGKVLVQAKDRIGAFPNRWETFDGEEGWKKFALSTGMGHVRVFSDAWNNQFQTEFVSNNTVHALAFLKDTDFLLAVSKISDQAGCLEIRDCSQGARIVRSLPFSSAGINWGTVSLRCSGSFAAFVLPKHIRIWNWGANTPFIKSTHLKGARLTGEILSPNGFEVLGFRNTSELKPSIGEICLFNTKAGWDAPKETAKILLPPEKAGTSPVLRGGMADNSLEIQWDGRGSRALVQNYGYALALNIESGGLKNIWGGVKKLLPYASYGERMVIHPEADLLWTGDAVVEFSTAKELTRINRGRFASYGRFFKRAGWLGTDRMVEACRVGANDGENADGYESNWIVVWDTRTGQPVAEELSPYGQCLAVSPQGALLAEGCKDNRVRLRNPKTLAVEREFRVHDSEVRNLDWHPTLPVLATLGRNEVRLWDVKSGRMLEEIRLKNAWSRLRFVADGRQLFVDWMLFEPRACAP